MVSATAHTHQITSGLTRNQIQRQDIQPLGIPARNLNVHLFHIALAGQLLILRLCIALFSTPQNLRPALSNLALPLLQPVPRLHPRNMLLPHGEQIPDARLAGSHRLYRELEEEHNHHSRTCLLDHRIDAVLEHPDVVRHAQEQRDGQAGMEQAWVGGRLLLKDLDAAFADPAPYLARDQRREHEQEEGTDFFAEDGHGQARLGDGEPSAFVQLLDLDGAEGAEAEALEAVHQGTIEDED